MNHKTAKRIEIKGQIRTSGFDDDHLLRYFGRMNLPNWGITISWRNADLANTYAYHIAGTENIGVGYIDALLALLQQYGTIQVARYQDMSEPEKWFVLIAST